MHPKIKIKNSSIHLGQPWQHQQCINVNLFVILVFCMFKLSFDGIINAIFNKRHDMTYAFNLGHYLIALHLDKYLVYWE